MTIVEFFDESQADNIISLLCVKYSRVVYIGESTVMTEPAISRIRDFVKERYPKTQVEFVYAKCDSVQDIAVKLTEIVLEYSDCCFEATGGTDASLIALGIISERYGVPIERTDVRTEADSLESLTVFEAIELNGGILESYEHNAFNIDYQMRRDVALMWRIGGHDHDYWISCGRYLSSLQPETLGLYVNSGKRPTDKQRSFLQTLYDAGFIEELQFSGGRVRFTYRDDEIRRTMIKSGNLLELLTFFAVLSRVPRSDAHRGVQLLWKNDGGECADRQGSCELVRNEIDVLFMKGICPVFISCKAGNVDKEALYELETVANRFGGKYASKILVAGNLGDNTKNPAQFIERASRMGIGVIDNAYNMTADRLGEEIMKKA